MLVLSQQRAKFRPLLPNGSPNAAASQLFETFARLAVCFGFLEFSFVVCWREVLSRCARLRIDSGGRINLEHLTAYYICLPE